MKIISHMDRDVSVSRIANFLLSGMPGMVIWHVNTNASCCHEVN